MLIGICLPGNALELQVHRRNFEPAGKGRNDTELFFAGTEHEVDWLDFQDLDEPAVRCLHDSVGNALNRNEILHEIKLFRFSSPLFHLFSLLCRLFSFCGAASDHNDIPPF